jgi:HEPN domain-containing protein
LKGFLIHNKISSPRTHNLVELINVCANIDKKFLDFMSKMATLSQFYIPTRYPDAILGMTPSGMPNQELARKALDYAHDVVVFCRDEMK